MINYLNPLKPSNPKDIIGSSKVPMSVVPANVLAEIAVALLEGAKKYGRHNYREVGVRNSIYYDAAMRHLMQWWEGEDIDPDSNLSHITKAITSLIVLRDSMIRNNNEDDRPPKSKNNIPDLNNACQIIIEKYKEYDPVHVTDNYLRYKTNQSLISKVVVPGGPIVAQSEKDKIRLDYKHFPIIKSVNN